FVPLPIDEWREGQCKRAGEHDRCRHIAYEMMIGVYARDDDEPGHDRKRPTQSRERIRERHDQAEVEAGMPRRERAAADEPRVAPIAALKKLERAEPTESVLAHACNQRSEQLHDTDVKEAAAKRFRSRG